MNRRNLLTSLIGIFGLASTAKAEDTTELAQLTAERNAYKAAALREKSRSGQLKFAESTELLKDGSLLINGKIAQPGYGGSIIMNGDLVRRCQAANAKEGWVEVATNAAKKTNCGPFEVEATSDVDQVVRTRVYGKVFIVVGPPEAFRIFQDEEFTEALGNMYGRDAYKQ